MVDIDKFSWRGIFYPLDKSLVSQKYYAYQCLINIWSTDKIEWRIMVFKELETICV